MMRVSLFVVVMAAVLALSAAEEAVKHQTEDVKQSSPLTAIQLPSSLNLSTNMVHALAVAGAVVVGLVGAVAVFALVLPMFGFRLCYLLGNCETYAHAYLAPTAYDAYAYSQPAYATAAYAKSYDGVTNELPYYEAYQHPQQAVTYPTGNSVAANVYQKRSLEYVGPILKMLSNAYEKYNHHPAQSKSVEGKTSSSSSAEPKNE